ncbi:MAG: methyltransferase domain-containing protein [candidate division Zixibacteria bacterium]|nr:methyltransferase domain-containing protein [candidate division Zixibacteria bacterium]
MHKSFQSLFVTPTGKNPLKYEGETADGRWTEGRLLCESEQLSFPVVDGIPLFIDKAVDPWADENRRSASLARLGVPSDQLIRYNYEGLLEWPDRGRYDYWIQSIIAHGGSLLELAGGPGGGFAPLILDDHPEATVLLSDLGEWVLRQWQNLSRELNRWPNLSFAQFDVTRLPLKVKSFDAVDSFGGISNIDGGAIAILESFRILKPGGRLFMVDATPVTEQFEALPREVQAEIRHNFPAIGKGYEKLVADAGFEIIDFEETSRRKLEPGESNLADIAGKYKIEMQIQFFNLEAKKPD